jgi:hypothetical protein
MWGGRHYRKGKGIKAEIVRCYGHVIRIDEGELVRYTMERRDRKKMWGGRYCRERERSV